ncbi:ABC transporter ATP-binding protein [Candidatus Shapirobacteria bacterium]|nr:ABC transporter ATP-binding protein [Candidatus Shapirobacteria bacterium]
MSPRPKKVLNFIFRIINDKRGFLFWLFIRFISAFLPLITIYQFSEVVKLLEQKSDLKSIIISVLWLFAVRIIDNFLRLISVTRLENAISNISFDIHNFLLKDLQSATKEARHQSIQAVRNFADASSMTLNLIKQPGVDSLVSLIFIPAALLFLDIRIFILVCAYNLMYLFIDKFTTQKYAHLKDILNTKTENYYAKLQETNDYDLEQISYSRHFSRLSHWSFTEWFTLQNTAVFFYTLVLLFLLPEVISGQREISGVVLIMGYVTQTQVLLNSLSQIKDSLTDMLVGLDHLAKNQSVSAINLDDLI